MATFKVPKLPIKRALIGPKLPTDENHDHTSRSVSDDSSSEQVSDGKKAEKDLQPQGPTAENLAMTSASSVPADTENTKLEANTTSSSSDIKLPYIEPAWSGKPPSGLYQLLVIKNGVEIGTVDVSSRSYCVCGRLPSCDIHLEHPSISRYHAVLQYRPDSDTTPQNESSAVFSSTPREAGFYLYDLSSTHGTYLTKNKLQPRCYYRMRVGQSVKFGGSSRLFVLDQRSESSQELVEAEAEEERAEITRKKEEYEEYLRKAEEEEERRKREQEAIGATWGMMMDDIVDESRPSEEMEIDPEKEAYYINDPKKALKTFFDREGLELEYECEDSGPNHNKTYSVKVCLPIYTVVGESVYAEATGKGKKKDVVVQCALEACRLLDAEGVLRESAHSRVSKLKELEENDYYDSDEDNFLDRTGDIERKRKRRMIRAGKINESVETYESLSVKVSSVQKEIQQLRNKLDKDKQISSSGRGDSLEDYMKTVSHQLDKTTISQIKMTIHQLQKEEGRLLKLMKVAKPYHLPGSEVKNTISAETNDRVGESETEEAAILKRRNRENESNKEEQQQQALRVDKKAIEDKVNSLLADVEGNDRGKKKAYGLIMPGEQSLKTEVEPPIEKKKKVGPALPPTLKKEDLDLSKVSVWEGDSDPDYASWMPPKDQTGDGRTKLNEKLGY